MEPATFLFVAQHRNQLRCRPLPAQNAYPYFSAE